MNDQTQTPQTPTEKLLSPSLLNRVADNEAGRRPIPPGELQSTLGEIGVVTSHDLPNVGEEATLRFQDGHEKTMTVTGYDKGNAHVNIPVTPGVRVASNVDLGSFERLTRETRNAGGAEADASTATAVTESPATTVPSTTSETTVPSTTSETTVSSTTSGVNYGSTTESTPAAATTSDTLPGPERPTMSLPPAPPTT